MIKTKEDYDVICVFLHTLCASYGDLKFYLIQLFVGKYFTEEEIYYVMSALNKYPEVDKGDEEDEDNFFDYNDDSDELRSEIEIMVDKIKSINEDVFNSISQQKALCTSKYELYILQRASFEFDCMLFDEIYDKFN